MNSNLIKKQIKAVAKTYTDQDFSLPLTEKEAHELAQKISKLLLEEKHLNLREIVHDVVYSFFTGQDE